MPALWPAFTAQMNSWFCGNAKGDGDEDYQAAGRPTAKKIADEYELAIKTAGITVPGNLVSSGWLKSTMQSGFEASFAQQFQAAGAPPEGIDIGVPVWIAAATGTVNAWAAVQYQPVPPHPPTVAPAPGVTQLDPGLGAIPALASSIHDAFHSNNCAAIAGILVSGFTQHLTMISGLYTGLVPTPAGPVPTPIPWMGVS
jgi:hypothetical protein|tara:strand:- start:2281 stop:2877 length:597 start_codon:yes stop_codon:yes gene_type:complete